MSNSNLLEEVVECPSNRRNFLARAGFIGLGVAATTMLGGSLGKVEAATTITDNDILNFALNLEYLEAEFYSVATFGATLVERGVIPKSAVSGPTTGGKMVPGIASSKISYLASGLRNDETNHVVFLRKALGSNAVKKPAINLDAMGFGFDNMNDFLRLGAMFEDVGMSAYLGAAPMIKNSTYLDAAARITATEGQHVAALRVYVIMNGLSTPKLDSMDVPPDPKHLFLVDSMGLSIPRTTAQVLKIVYAGGSHSGGFYPNGFNGIIK